MKSVTCDPSRVIPLFITRFVLWTRLKLLDHPNAIFAPLMIASHDVSWIDTSAVSLHFTRSIAFADGQVSVDKGEKQTISVRYRPLVLFHRYYFQFCAKIRGDRGQDRRNWNESPENNDDVSNDVMLLNEFRCYDLSLMLNILSLLISGSHVFASRLSDRRDSEAYC